MGLLDIIRKPKPLPARPESQQRVEPWMWNLTSTEEFITGCLLGEVPLSRFTDREVMPQQKLEETQKGLKDLAVNAYRRTYQDSGGEVGASPEMPDDLILEIYRHVGCSFRAVARERGEVIHSAIINKIVLKFIDVYRMSEQLKRNPEGVEGYESLKENLPTLENYDFFEDHLRYEIEKYRREGLRADYSRNPLHLFRHPSDDVKSS